MLGKPLSSSENEIEVVRKQTDERESKIASKMKESKIAGILRHGTNFQKDRGKILKIVWFERDREGERES